MTNRERLSKPEGKTKRKRKEKSGNRNVRRKLNEMSYRLRALRWGQDRIAPSPSFSLLRVCLKHVILLYIRVDCKTFGTYRVYAEGHTNLSNILYSQSRFVPFITDRSFYCFLIISHSFVLLIKNASESG